MIKAIVTGHSGGLGAALAADLLSRGIVVLGLARRTHAPLGAAHADALQQHALDLSDADALSAWLAGPTLAGFLADASMALLINNAGMLQPVGPCGGQDPMQITAAVQLNLGAPLLLANAFVAASGHCAERRIAHISSGAARNAYAGWGIYCATKAGLDQHARATALDGLPRLRIASLAPGVVDTGMQAEVRASDPAGFPQQARFAALKAEGQLSAPADAARRLVDHLLGDAFGREPTGDLRTLSAA